MIAISSNIKPKINVQPRLSADGLPPSARESPLVQQLEAKQIAMFWERTILIIPKPLYAIIAGLNQLQIVLNTPIAS